MQYIHSHPHCLLATHIDGCKVKPRCLLSNEQKVGKGPSKHKGSVHTQRVRSHTKGPFTHKGSVHTQRVHSHAKGPSTHKGSVLFTPLCSIVPLHSSVLQGNRPCSSHLCAQLFLCIRPCCNKIDHAPPTKTIHQCCKENDHAPPTYVLNCSSAFISAAGKKTMLLPPMRSTVPLYSSMVFLRAAKKKAMLLPPKLFISAARKKTMLLPPMCSTVPLYFSLLQRKRPCSSHRNYSSVLQGNRPCSSHQMFHAHKSFI